MRYLLGRNAVRVTAQTWNPKVSNAKGDMGAFVWVEFEDGARVNYTGTFVAPLVYIAVVALVEAFAYSVILGDIHRLDVATSSQLSPA